MWTDQLKNDERVAPLPPRPPMYLLEEFTL